MFYADELYWMDSNETVPANYSLQLDKSSCKTSSIEADNTNHTSTVYVFEERIFSIDFRFFLSSVWN